MKKWTLPLLASALLTLPWACATLLPEPILADVTRSQAAWPGLQLSDLQKGRELYVKNCAGCHDLHAPAQLEAAQWERIMVKMQRKAKIDDETKDNIMKYLLTFAKDAKNP